MSSKFPTVNTGIPPRTAFAEEENVTDGSTGGRRRLVVCIDGTSNQFSKNNTNVVELYNRIRKDKDQLTYYNSGIGTFAKPSWRSYAYLKQVVYNKIDLAIAWNLEKVIIGAYRWLSDVYRPGDQIFLFGFSRGAYQVRALAAMLHIVGLIHAGNQEQIPFAWELYSSVKPGDTEDEKMVSKFRETFCQDVGIHFLGAWDTVSSIGVFRDRLLPMTQECKHITHFRHALALDECRIRFLPEYVAPETATADEHPKNEVRSKAELRSVKEVWFPGTHSDIGGGNAENIDLDRGAPPLKWMMEEAESKGLRLEPREIHGLGMNYTRVTESLNWVWWILEILPLSRPSYVSGDSVTRRPHWGGGRKVLIEHNHRIHWTVLANTQAVIQSDNYEPKATLELHGKKVDWKVLFDPISASMSEHSELSHSQWEGDTRLVETLKLVKDLRNSGPLKPDWLSSVRTHATDSGNAKATWEYGGAEFIQRLAIDPRVTGDEDDNTLVEIIMLLVGWRHNDEPQEMPTPAGDKTQEGPRTADDAKHPDVISAVLPRVEKLFDLCAMRPDSPPLVDEHKQESSVASHVPLINWVGYSSIGLTAWSWVRNVLGGVPSIAIAKGSSSKQQTQPPVRLAAAVMQVISELLKTHARAIYRTSDLIENLPLLIPNPPAPIDANGAQPVRSPSQSGRDAFHQNVSNTPSQPPIRIMELITKVLESNDLIVQAGLSGSSSSDVAASKLVGFLRIEETDLELVRSTLRALRAFCKIDMFRYFLSKKEVGGKLAALFVTSGPGSDDELLLDELLATIALLSGHDEEGLGKALFRSFPQIFERIKHLAPNHPNAIRVIQRLIEHDEIEDKNAVREVFAETVSLLKSENIGLVQASIEFIAAHAASEDLISLLVQHDVTTKLVQLSGRNQLAPVVTRAMQAITPHRELVNQSLVDYLFNAVEKGTDQDALVAIERISSLDAYNIPQDFILTMIESMRSDNTTIVYTAISVISKLAVTSDRLQNRTVIWLVAMAVRDLLGRALEQESYGIHRQIRVDITIKAFGVIKLLSPNDSFRELMIITNGYQTVKLLTDGPVSLTLDHAAQQLMDDIQGYSDIQGALLEDDPTDPPSRQPPQVHFGTSNAGNNSSDSAGHLHDDPASSTAPGVDLSEDPSH